MFSKDDEGCITAEELKFVLTHLPGKVGQTKFSFTKHMPKVTYKEIDEMIQTVDKNGDGKINYSEFRVMMGAHPLIMPGRLFLTPNLSLEIQLTKGCGVCSSLETFFLSSGLR